jgi:hypothetical protein
MRRFEHGPAIALLGVWLLAGLAGALAVAEVEGDVRHLALGVVTLPSLALIVRAMRLVGRAG